MVSLPLNFELSLYYKCLLHYKVYSLCINDVTALAKLYAFTDIVNCLNIS